MNLAQNLKDRGFPLETTISPLTKHNRYFATGSVHVEDKHIHFSTLGVAEEQPTEEDLIPHLKIERIVQTNNGAVTRVYGGDSIIIQGDTVLAHSLSIEDTDDESVILANKVYDIVGDIQSLQDADELTEEQIDGLRELGFQEVLKLN